MTKIQISIHDFKPAAMIHVRGDDAFGFLQGQFSNDLRQPIGAVTYGLWLTHKGKVVADSHVLRLAENEFKVISLSSPAPTIMKRLEDFIVADDVQLTDETVSLGGLVIAGVGCGPLLTEITGIQPEPGKFFLTRGGWIFPGRRGGEESYEFIGSENEVSLLKHKFSARGAVATTPEELKFRRIAAGIPEIPTDFGLTDLPNEAALEAATISYTKGCYLGQEVMARLKNLGQVRRSLRVLRSTGALPAAKAALFQGNIRVGEIRSAAELDGKIVALAMLSLVTANLAQGFSLAPETSPTLTLESHE